MSVEVVTNPSVHSKAEIVGETFEYVGPSWFALFIDHNYHPVDVLFLDNVPFGLVSEHLGVPHIELLDDRILNFQDEVMKLVEVIVEDAVLLPAEVFGEVVACTQRKRSENDFIEIYFGCD